jgi:hypothetical protein
MPLSASSAVERFLRGRPGICEVLRPSPGESVRASFARLGSVARRFV